MLPEVISNGLASLQKGRLRYAKSAFVEFTPEGTPLHVEFANSAIKVTRRFAYEQVMPVVEGREGHVRVSAKVKSLLRDMHKLAMTLRKKRFRSGALELYLPEVKIDFSKTGRVSGAHETEHDESHQMIEEFMLAANIAVATNLADREVPCLRRTHADPDHRKLEAFARFAGALGYKLKQFQSRSHLQKLLNEVRGEPTEQAINFALLRSMKQAEYAAVDVGHFALAVAHYCHFTSPIRRYPDLMIHRLIDGIVAGKRRPRGPGQAELQKMGTLCSNTERRAAGAERELVKVKLLTYMSERIDDEFEAVITGVERFGVFSRGVELPAEGFTHISWLSESDHFYHDADSMSLIGRRSGTTYRLGDRVRVRVAHVDVDRRELDYHFVNEGATSGTRRRKASSKEAPARGTKRQGVSKAKRGQSGRKPAGKKKTTQHKGGSGKGLAKGTKGPAKKKGKGRKRRR